MTTLPSTFEPFVPPDTKTRELTPKSIFFGVLFAAIFGVSSVYLALRAGMTLGGSISIAVIAVGLLKRFGKTTLLENNMVQSIGSAGESMAGGIIFRISGFLFLIEGAKYFTYSQIVTCAIIGGLLGILFMIPLRRSLIVKEHHKLLYPEGKACAEVLIAGEKQGPVMKPVLWGSLVGTIYWVLMQFLGLWKEVPYIIHRAANDRYPNAILNIEVTPEYLGIGYIVGLRTTFQIFIGSMFTWLILVPFLSAWPQVGVWLGGKDVAGMLHNLGVPIGTILGPPTGAQVHSAYGKFIAIGAVIFAGVGTLIRTIPVIVASFKNAVESLKARTLRIQLRTDKDIPIGAVILGIVALVILMPFFPYLPGKFPLSILISLLIILFSFFFVTVSSRLVGVVGYSMEPTGPMMYTTVMITCVIFFLLKLTHASHQPMVLMIAAIAITAAGNAGATSQDLKTGFLVGATPWKQQIGLIVGVVISTLLVGGIVILIDRSIPGVSHAIGYLAPGEDAPKFAAPAANLVAILIQAFFSEKIPWGLMLLGAMLAGIARMCRLNALAFAAGIYLPMSVTTAMFFGALIRYVVTKREKKNDTPSETKPPTTSELSPGMLYATGLVAAGSIAGMVFGLFGAFFPKQASMFDLGKSYWKSISPWGDYLSVLTFLVLGFLLYQGARRKLRV